MSKQHRIGNRNWRGWTLAAVLCFAAAAAATAQQPLAAQQAAAPQDQAQTTAKPQASDKGNTTISPAQAKELFSLVDELLKFSSEETGLPIKSTVKRQLTTRAAVESFLKKKFEEDEGAKRMQRDEIVLKKFGLLDRDFALKPFLLALLKEQIEAYYDSKTKTVNLLDWVDIEEQKPVLAHELTHALQDQHTDLEKWNDQTPLDVSTTTSADSEHLAKDEMDTAREAVVEGQATAVMMDYILKPMGRSLIKDPEVMDFVKQRMSGSEDSPVLARAPLLLSESMLFPYREGLSFEQDVWMDQGQAAAFAGAMDRPPTSSWEIINPLEYEKRHVPTIPLLPNIHPLVDKLYVPYDIGQMGQLDLRILAEIFGGEQAARDLSPAWDGGLYWAGQRRSAKTDAEKASTNSLAIFYLSAWKNAASAQAFAQLYASALGRKYSGLKLVPATANAVAAADEQVYSTSEGPVLITTRGKLVFVAESFDLELARKLTALVLDAQGTGELRLAGGQGAPRVDVAARKPLTAGLVQFFSNCGVMKAAVDAGLHGTISAR
ncbi:MAG: hypothetical protein P4K86_13255 [Terracidiphilus sp.]|nr:hypothetical protein [Terracidiphilus sp.]MDR3776039.1 hypothetical protein [Terracidiphilus sp.]